MAKNSKIEWTDHTGNLWWGCTKVHAGCDNCYAEALAKRTGQNVWGNGSPRLATRAVWHNFLQWQAEARHSGAKRRVFVGSMMDIFEKPMPLNDWNGNEMPGVGSTSFLRDRFFGEIVPSCPELVFLLLTKRPGNINKYIPQDWKGNPPPNVWFGTSPVCPKTFDILVRQLKEVSGNRFLSIEPQLEFISPLKSQLEGIGWVIQGGESGPRKRPFNTDWARAMKGICAATGTPYFFKQIDKIQPIPPDLQIRQFPDF